MLEDSRLAASDKDKHLSSRGTPMTGTLALAAVLGLPCDPWLREQAEMEQSVEIHTHELRAHVYRLASPEFKGRRGPGAARASKLIADAFERLKLKPLFKESYYQSIPSLVPDKETGKEGFIGRNVGAFLPGSDPALKDEWILLSAHLDHVGIKDDKLYPGADDNATGVAMLLEVAEYFALRKEQPRRTIAFVAFDQEEAGLLGSTHFCVEPPRPLGNLQAFLTADMLGRSMANVMDEYVFVLGSESAPQLRKLVEDIKPEKGLKIGRLSAELIGTRSDYGPFRDRKIPFLFFSTGQHPDYHQPTDRPDRIDYEKLRRNAVLIRDVTLRLADADEPPKWDARPNLLDVEEIKTIHVLVRRVLDKPELFPLTEKKRELVEGVATRLETIIKRGEVKPADRTWLLWNARLLLVSVF
jgi:Peptidase family M28